MILKKEFGRTGYNSSRIIFGAYALSKSTQEEADQTLEILLNNEINFLSPIIDP